MVVVFADQEESSRLWEAAGRAKEKIMWIGSDGIGKYEDHVKNTSSHRSLGICFDQ